MPLKIGITGGIGSGKTTVLQCFEKLGIPAFVADRCAASYYEEEDFVCAVEQIVGRTVRRSDGVVDKRLIADSVFRDGAMLRQLNTLVHPRVMADFAQWLAQQDAPYVLFESALIYGGGLQGYFDKIVAVYLDVKERMRRVMLRDHTTPAEIEQRMANQSEADRALLEADYVVLNYEGNPRLRQVETIHRTLLQLAACVSAPSQ
ncbi:MAG: dephospho-CoA kinase [Bacteroidales bacterium]|nr:dephospho-CoA kinase [Bacteroidales bacterium]